jgi:hypothetical protein
MCPDTSGLEGKITFGVSVEDRLANRDPPAPVVQVECVTHARTEDDEMPKDLENRYGACEISAGDVVNALYAAIRQAAQG